MVTCTQIPITIPPDGSLSNSTIHALISAILPLEWPSVDPSALLVTRQTGHANTNCIVSRPAPPPPSTATEPLAVFLKINGPLDGEIAVFAHLVPDKHQESQLCHELGQSGRGPRLYGFFRTRNGAYGRVDEFLEARTLTAADVEDEGVRADVAQAQAAFHAQRTERERKSVAAYYDALTGSLARFRGLDKLKSLGRAAGVPIDDVVEYDFASRIGRVTAALDRMGAKTGWCIHDVQYGNTLLRTTTLPAQPRAVLIDYEFVFANYRGVDVGGHFLHKLLQWFGGDGASKLTGARPYAAGEKRHYCEAYAAQWTQDTGETDDGETVLGEAALGYVLAASFEVHNILHFLEEEGEEDASEMEALRMLFGEFVREYEGLGLEE